MADENVTNSTELGAVKQPIEMPITADTSDAEKKLDALEKHLDSVGMAVNHVDFSKLFDNGTRGLDALTNHWKSLMHYVEKYTTAAQTTFDEKIGSNLTKIVPQLDSRFKSPTDAVIAATDMARLDDVSQKIHEISNTLSDLQNPASAVFQSLGGERAQTAIDAKISELTSERDALEKVRDEILLKDKPDFAVEDSKALGRVGEVAADIWKEAQNGKNFSEIFSTASGEALTFSEYLVELFHKLQDVDISQKEFIKNGLLSARTLVDNAGGIKHVDILVDKLADDLYSLDSAFDKLGRSKDTRLGMEADEIGIDKDVYAKAVDNALEQGKGIGCIFNTGVETELDKATRKPGDIFEKNMGVIKKTFQDMFYLRHAGYGENKADVSSAVNIGAQMADSFKSANESILKQAQDLKNKASKIYSSIPEAVKRTPGGTVVNQVAMDATKAYAEVGTLVSKLEKIPNAVKSTKEYDALSKQLTKLQDDYDKAFNKRSMFVLQTNDTALKSFDNFERQIKEQTSLLQQYQERLAKLQAMRKGTIPKGAVDGLEPTEKSINETRRSIKQVEKDLQRLRERQQFYAQNRADATLKREYDTYSYKLVTINQQLEETRQKMADLQAQGGVSNLADKMQEADSIVGEINTKLKELGKLSKDANKEQRLLGRSAQGLGDKYRGVEAPAGYKKTEQFKEYEKGYRAAYKALQNLYELEKQYIASGKSTDSTAWTNLATRIDSAKSKLADYNKYMDQAIANGNAFVSKQASSKNWIDLRWSDVFGSGWGKVFGDAMKAASNSFKKTTSITFGALKKMLEGIWSLVPKIGKGIKDWAKNQKSLGDSAKQMYKTFTGYLSMLRTRIRRKFVSMVFEDLQNNIKALAKMSPRLNKVISDFIVSTKTLGAQIVAAFEPLVAKVLPYITMFVDYLTYAAQQMSQFISQLFGDDTWIKAVKGQYNFAESVDNSTSSTKKATKAAKEYENTVLSFDELHKLNGNASGSDEDADGLTGVDLKHAEVEANKLMEIARKIHKALSEGDFYGAGKAMGEGVNEAFAWLRDTAGWSKNADKFTKWAENAINLVNGLIDGIDGLANGQTIGDVINSVINIADKLTDPENGIHFYDAGKTLGETFVSALLEIDWQTAGRALMNGLQGIARGVTGFLTAQVYTMKNKTTGETRYARKDETGRPVWNDGTVVDPNEWDIEEDAMTGAQALGRGLHNMFSEAVKTFNVDTWSDLLASLVKEFFTFIGELFSEPEKAAEFGRKVGQLINETFEKIDAESVAGGINNFVASLTSFFESAFDETDWSGVFSKFKEIGELVDWAPIGKIIGIAMAPGLVTGLFSAVGSLVKTLGTAWLVSKILGIGGSGAAGGAAAGGAGLLGWLGAGAKTVGSILLGSYAGVGWSEFLGQVTNGKLGISEEHANKFYQDPFGGIGKTIQADILGLKQMVGDIAGNVFGAEWGKDWYNSATQGLQAISDKVNGVQESVDAMNSDEFNTMWSQMKDEMYGDDTKLMNMDGQTFLDNATTSIPSLTLPADGSILSSAPTEDFRNGLAEEVGAAFFDALTKTAGDVVMVVNGNEIGRVAMNYMAKYNKQYLATKPAVT